MIITGVTEEQFYRELQVNCFINQIDGYPVGHPARGLEYRPIVPFKKNDDGTYNRAGTLEMTAFTFTDEEKKTLLTPLPAAAAKESKCRCPQLNGPDANQHDMECPAYHAEKAIKESK